MLNGKTKWLLWLAGGVLTIFIAVISFMGVTVRANEDKRVLSEKDITKTIHTEDDKVRTEFKYELKEVRTEQKALIEKVGKNHTEVMVAIESLK